MTGFEIHRIDFHPDLLRDRSNHDPRLLNWPVVYALNGDRRVYVGQTNNAIARFRQHYAREDRRNLSVASIVLDDTFNTSVCLDLESTLIGLFHGDGGYSVLNSVGGMSNADYFRREEYRQIFAEIFEALRAEGLFTRTLEQIRNSDLFKLSPFKSLTIEQEMAIHAIVESYFHDLDAGVQSRSVVQGDPGTGKTIVGIYLMKLLSDIRDAGDTERDEVRGVFEDFFQVGFPELLDGRRIGLVVPQQSLRKSIKNVFKKTPGLTPDQVLSPFDVGKSDTRWDLLIVDEAHRLSQRARQGSGMQNAAYASINVALFGADALRYTQLDWIAAQSERQILLLDGGQSVRPGDLPRDLLREIEAECERNDRLFRLQSQMRVEGDGGARYVEFTRRLFDDGGQPTEPFDGYDLRFYSDLGAMRRDIVALDAQHGLSRLLAGYAWKWVSKTNPSAYDIELDGERLQWNGTDVDWVNSPTSLSEVGSIHTIQGYDLNYAGVIVGRDLRFDEQSGRVLFDRRNYFDARGMSNNRQLGIVYSDDDILQFVKNIYAVLLTRGMRGTFIYVCDPALRRWIQSRLASVARFVGE